MRYRIGEHVLDPRKFELRKGDRVVPAEPQVLSLLILLLENRDRLVAKDELVATIWHGRAVSDSAISSRIRSARKLLGDDGDAQRLIRTVHGKGFRFVGCVSAEEGESKAVTSAGAAAGAVASAPARATLRRRTLLVHVLAAGLPLLIGLLLWRFWHTNQVTVVVTPTTASPYSDWLARDLTAKLAMLTGARDGKARLLERANGQKPDFRFNIDASADGAKVEGNLVLLDKDGELLWSKGFGQHRSKLSDLKQQLAFTGGKVLDCAIDTVAKTPARLSRQVIKLYLNGCAAYADSNARNLADIRVMFRSVVDAAPGFEPGWRMLLLTEAATLEVAHLNPPEANLHRARQTLAEARRVEPSMAQIFALQGKLVPSTSMTDRIRFMEMAVRRAPTDPDIAAMHSSDLFKVGRLNAAVDEAARSVRIDPLSPVNRQTLVIALAMAGRMPEAEHELREAEALWPGSTTLREARFTLHLRIADPSEAIRLRNSGLPMPSMSPYVGSFLTARSNPTPANVEVALRDAQALYTRSPSTIAHLSQALAAFHREGELFQILLNWPYPEKVDQVTGVLFRPAFHNFRRDPRFIRVADRLGLLDYWQSSGKWPDFCFDPDLPYDCKKVASAIMRARA
jgi:DNA-binding winged helix-turn-helix (wHTH) protein